MVDKFQGISASGVILHPADVTAVTLLFERVYLPANAAVIRELVEHEPSVIGAFAAVQRDRPIVEVHFDEHDASLLEGLSNQQKALVAAYIGQYVTFAIENRELFGSVFETDLFNAGAAVILEPAKTKFSEAIGGTAQRVSNLASTVTDNTFRDRINAGYIPFASRSVRSPSAMAATTTLQLAALLAMQSVKMVLPMTRPTTAEEILHARERLRDHLPPFWSAMLKLTAHLRRLPLQDPQLDIVAESRELVDAIVRPALIDLREKLLRERRDWAYRILSPIQKGLRLLVGAPPLSQQQLITSALLLASDVAVSAADHMRVIDSLTREAGLTFLLRAQDQFDEAG